MKRLLTTYAVGSLLVLSPLYAAETGAPSAQDTNIAPGSNPPSDPNTIRPGVNQDQSNPQNRKGTGADTNRGSGNFENPSMKDQTAPRGVAEQQTSISTQGSVTATVESVDAKNETMRVRDDQGRVTEVNIKNSSAVDASGKRKAVRKLKSGDSVTYTRNSDGSVKKITVN